MKKSLLCILYFFCIFQLSAQDGVLDPAFGTGGTVIINESSSYSSSLMTTYDNKIIGGGSFTNTDNFNIAFLKRFNQNGIEEVLYDLSGSLPYETTHNYIRNTIILSGSLYVLDQISTYTEDSGFSDTTRLRKYNYNTGNPDLTIGNNGQISIPGFYSSYFTVQPDGKFVLCGQKTINLSQLVPVIYRYNPDGTIDTSFGMAGEVTIPTLGGMLFKVVLDSGNNIFVVGANGIAKYDTTGQPVSAFGNNGIIKSANYINPFFHIYSLEFTLNNKIIVAGVRENTSSPQHFDMAVYGYNQNGSIDTSFGTNGVAIAEFGTYVSKPFDMIQQTDGKILLAGFVEDENNWENHRLGALTRLNANGTIDSSFGSNGWVVYNSPYSQDARFTRVQLQSNGAIVIAGGINDAFIQKYLSGNSLGEIDFENDNSTYIYPNPLNETSVLEYTLTGDETVQIELTDVNGRVLKTYVDKKTQPAGLHKQYLNTGDLPSGTYFITLTSVEGKITVKAIK